MFKILALIIAISSGQPLDVLVSKNTPTECPDAVTMATIRDALQAQLDAQDGLKNVVKVDAMECVKVEDVEDVGNRLMNPFPAQRPSFYPEDQPGHWGKYFSDARIES